MFNCNWFLWIAWFSRAWFSLGAFCGMNAECCSLSRHGFSIVWLYCVFWCFLSLLQGGRFILNLPILSGLETRHPAQIQVEKLCWWKNGPVPTHVQLDKLLCQINCLSSSLTHCRFSVFRIICDCMNYPLVLLQNLYYNKWKSVCLCFGFIKKKIMCVSILKFRLMWESYLLSRIFTQDLECVF